MFASWAKSEKGKRTPTTVLKTLPPKNYFRRKKRESNPKRSLYRSSKNCSAQDWCDKAS